MDNQSTSKFLILYQDANYALDLPPETQKALTKQHVARIKDMDAKGLLFFCGILNGEEGMMIIHAKTLEEAEAFVKNDPFIINNCYKHYAVYDIQEANAENNYLL